ncbi:hypothetical protein GCM10008967_28680 [Bacillus carboniphilus]|uniref:Uncharacterized protein n=1 Tax=Bacillus carboniphilus TaxID=86663 RepID=A0ABN0WG67_9BACI
MIGVLVVTPILILSSIIVFLMVRKSKISGTKFMLLGLSFLIFGGIFVIDTDTYLEGVEYLVVYIGLILSVVGFAKN